QRCDPLAAVRELLPAGLKMVGFLGTADDIDISFWRPFGTRRVAHILTSETGREIRERGIRYAVVSELALEEGHTTLTAWTQRVQAEITATNQTTVKISS